VAGDCRFAICSYIERLPLSIILEAPQDHHHNTQIPQIMGLTTVEEQAAAVLDALRKGGGEWERKLPNTHTIMTEQQGIYINETQRINIQQQQ